ncbi:flagellar motor protein MotB [Phenylobacterium sp.]|uniref:OmpA/MotB family protein n=1 Tax=Phenylobacterium sp. TaxID=1871053 RepID=UPI0035B428FF
MTFDEPHEADIEEENYFVSMTDMMVGLVFIFIILLMYYVLQFRDVTEQLSGADRTRTEILHKLQKTLKENGVIVSIDTQNGVLRLPDAILFDSARAELKPEGLTAVGHLADALADVLPCYTDLTGGSAQRPARCPPDNHHRIEALYVEGHTDADALKGAGMLRDNWDLSALRATNTYRALTSLRPALAAECSLNRNGDCEPVLSVSGYGPQRLIDRGPTDEDKRRNRRIDLRLIMVTPDSGATAGALRQRLEAQ